MVASRRARERDDEDDQREGADGDGEESAERGGEDGLEEIFHERWERVGVVEMMLSCLLFANQKLNFDSFFPLDAAPLGG